MKMLRMSMQLQCVAGLATALVGLNVSTAGAAGTSTTIASRFLNLECGEQSGRFSLTTLRGEPLVLNAGSGVQAEGHEAVAASPQAGRRVVVTESGDRTLSGPVLVLTTTDLLRQAETVLTATLLAEMPAAVFELQFRNLGTTGVVIESLDPLRAVATEEGGCLYPASKVLTNGRIYYDPGKVLDFAPAQSTEIQSFYNAAFYNPATGGALVAGFLDNESGEGFITARRGGSGTGFELTARSRMHSRVSVPPGGVISSGRLLMTDSPDAFAGLESYAALCGKLHNVRLNPIINGWSTWSHYYGDITEEEVVKNAEFIARELKPYGMDWVQIDDGFQQNFGDWEGKPAKFPSGMKGTAAKIRALGLKAGLWIAPFAVSSGSLLAREHPDWLVHRADESLQPLVPAHQGQAQYILDATHPGSQQWLRDLLRRLTDDWGYDFIKTDFSEWTLLAAGQYFDKSASASRAYRLGVEAIRAGMGPLRHMLDCGPGLTAIGLIDSMRIELDRPIPENPLWAQYAGYYNSTGPAVAKRYYFHNRTWINDADQIRLVGLTLAQSRAACTITALSGGTVIAGDALYKLDAERLDMLKRVLPAHGQAARPLDLFATDAPELFHLLISRTWGEWSVLGCFNWGDQPRERMLDPETLGVEPGEHYLAFDFWSQRLLADTTGPLTLKQEPTSVNLLGVHKRTGAPQLVSTDRHFTQGAVELKDVRWDEGAATLSGVALGNPGLGWNICVYVPNGYAVDETGAAGLTLDGSAVDNQILQATVTFDDGTDEVPWKISFSKTTSQ